ncbi:hypothetical protein EC968_007769 [Mortierella alpina]|nr:hypothetical protein EC968_007769 [Mortierella alpina]
MDAQQPAPGGNGVDPPPNYYKYIGMGLAVSSGAFIGASFVVKKKGLLLSSAIAGEGHAYLRSPLWWTGMVMSELKASAMLMLAMCDADETDETDALPVIVGEICNFIAYSFAPALIVTPLGALSVVVCAVLSSLVLKEKLNLHGKIGCALCIVGAVVIVLHAPAQAAVTDIDQFKHFVIQPGFLVYMCLVIAVSLVIVWKVAPKYGKNHLLVYITVCSLIGSLSVVATQGLGAAIVLNITTGTPQFNHWFIYVTIVFVICTMLTEINYLNKSLNLFNTAVVTPVYYVFFTSATLVASVILFQGFKASGTSIMTVVMGFLVICAGVILLQTSKSAVLSEAMKKSKSTLSIRSDDEDDEKDELDPGPMELRAVPFDSIRQMVRASTMPNSPFSHPATPNRSTASTNHHQRDPQFSHNTLFSRLHRRTDQGAAAHPRPTTETPLQGVIILPDNDDDLDHPSEQSPPVHGLGPAVVLQPIEKQQTKAKEGTLPQESQEKGIEAKTAVDQAASRNKVAATPTTSTPVNVDEPSETQLISTASTLREKE